MMKNEELKSCLKESNKSHKIWHDFCKHMEKWYYQEIDEYKYSNKKTLEQMMTGKKIKVFDVTKMIGYECMCRVEKYAEKHTEIKITHVDDDVYSGSDLVLIPHPKHGVTVIFIPQCTTVNNTFFLYPGHLEYFQETLENMKQEYDGFLSDFDKKCEEAVRSA
jgi:hypothetical protein